MIITEDKLRSMEIISRLPIHERAAVAESIIKSGLMEELICPDWRLMAQSCLRSLINYYPNCYSMTHQNAYAKKRIGNNSEGIQSLLAMVYSNSIVEEQFWDELKRLYGISRWNLAIDDIQKCIDEKLEEDVLDIESRFDDMLIFFLRPLRARMHLNSTRLEVMLHEVLLDHNKITARGKDRIKVGEIIRGRIAAENNQFLLVISQLEVVWVCVWDIHATSEVPHYKDTVALRWTGQHFDVLVRNSKTF